MTTPLIADPQELERLNKAAKMLNVCDDTLRSWCKSGRVKYHRMGAKLIMISRSEITRLIRESQVEEL